MARPTPFALLLAFAVFWGCLGLRTTPAAAHETPDKQGQTLSIDKLPHEIGAALAAWKPACGDRLTAGALFARITEVSGRRYVTLHFEELACVDRRAICNADGCRHEVYALSDGRFHRVFTRETVGLNLHNHDNIAVLELDCGVFGCLRALRWNGRAFLETAADGPDTEHIFGFTEGADVGLAAENELESTFTSRFGRPGDYHVIENETAFRHLWADGLRTSLAVLSDSHEVHQVAGLPDTSTVGLNGLGGELRWQLLSRDRAPFALTLSFEPQWRRFDGNSGQPQTSVGLPVILLADIALVPDKVFAAFNMNYTPALARMPVGWASQSTLEVSAALSVALRPDIYLGAEVRHLAAFDGAFLDGQFGEAWYVGPSIFFALPSELMVKLAWSAQVSGHTASSDRLDLVNFERHQARFQVVKGL